MKKTAYELGYLVGMQKAAAKEHHLDRMNDFDVEAGGKLLDYGVGAGLGAAGGAGLGGTAKLLKNLLTGESGGYTPWLLGGAAGGAGLGLAGVGGARGLTKMLMKADILDKMDDLTHSKLPKKLPNLKIPGGLVEGGVRGLLNEFTDQDMLRPYNQAIGDWARETDRLNR